MDEKLEIARNRMQEMEFSEQEMAVLFYDWNNWEEHIEWLLSASKVEILDWLYKVM